MYFVKEADVCIWNKCSQAIYKQEMPLQITETLSHNKISEVIITLLRFLGQFSSDKGEEKTGINQRVEVLDEASAKNRVKGD